jgi:hypothetical protein
MAGKSELVVSLSLSLSLSLLLSLSLSLSCERNQGWIHLHFGLSLLTCI